jgi:hypothetical protein
LGLLFGFQRPSCLFRFTACASVPPLRRYPLQPWGAASISARGACQLRLRRRFAASPSLPSPPSGFALPFQVGRGFYLPAFRPVNRFRCFVQPPTAGPSFPPGFRSAANRFASSGRWGRGFYHRRVGCQPTSLTSVFPPRDRFRGEGGRITTASAPSRQILLDQVISAAMLATASMGVNPQVPSGSSASFSERVAASPTGEELGPRLLPHCPKEPVTEREGDVEVVAAHQAQIMVRHVVLPQP